MKTVLTGKQKYKGPVVKDLLLNLIFKGKLADRV